MPFTRGAHSAPVCRQSGARSAGLPRNLSVSDRKPSAAAHTWSAPARAFFGEGHGDRRVPGRVSAIADDEQPAVRRGNGPWRRELDQGRSSVGPRALVPLEDAVRSRRSSGSRAEEGSPRLTFRHRITCTPRSARSPRTYRPAWPSRRRCPPKKVEKKSVSGPGAGVSSGGISGPSLRRSARATDRRRTTHAAMPSAASTRVGRSSCARWCRTPRGERPRPEPELRSVGLRRQDVGVLFADAVRAPHGPHRPPTVPGDHGSPRLGQPPRRLPAACHP